MADLDIYLSSLPGLTDEELETEARSASALLARARKTKSNKAVVNLKKMRAAIAREKKSRKESAMPKNPKKKSKKRLGKSARAGIGAGVGALALGPVGAIGGAYLGSKYRAEKTNNPMQEVMLPHTGTLPASAMPMYSKVFDSAYKYYKTKRGATKEQAEEIAARTAWDEIERYYYKRGDRWIKRKKALPQVRRPHEVQLPNPLAHIPKGAGIRKIRDVVSQNIATEMETGKPQQQAIAIAIHSAREDAERVGGNTAKLILSEYPRQNPELPATGTLPKAAMPMYEAVFNTAYRYYKTQRGATKEQAEEIAARTAWDEIKRYYMKKGNKWVKRKKPLPQEDRPHDVELSNPRKKRKKKPKKNKSTSPAQSLIKKCQKTWEQYCARPSKKRLKEVFSQLGKMERSGAKSVKEELRRCRRAARAEAKKLGMKM